MQATLAVAAAILAIAAVVAWRVIPSHPDGDPDQAATDDVLASHQDSANGLEEAVEPTLVGARSL